MSMVEPSNLATKRRFRDRLQVMAHLLTAFVMACEGIARIEQLHEQWPFIAFLFASSVIVLVISVSHKKIKARLAYSQSALYFLEGIVSLVIAVMYVKEGKAAVQYPFFIASYLFTAFAGFSLARPSRASNE